MFQDKYVEIFKQKLYNNFINFINLINLINLNISIFKIENKFLFNFNSN
jgi:hypothetical protein